MKPDKNTCLNCGKEISKRAKYCSDKCRKAYERNPDKRSDKLNSDTDKTQVGQPKSDNTPEKLLGFSLTKTDRTFFDRALRDFTGEDGSIDTYYAFTEDIEERKCILQSCGAKFKTGLGLLHYCSYDHYKASLGGRK